MIEIGHYRFTTHDARATLRHALGMFDNTLPAAHPVLTARRSSVADLLDGIDPHNVADAELANLLNPVWDLLCGIPDDLTPGSAAAPTQVGVVAGLFRSDGGVPKTSINTATVGFGGVDGDRQATRRHHGRPWQALCLWSHEVIDELVGEGHPVTPGGAGENILLSGIDWATLGLGSTLRIGTVTCHVMAHTIPCTQLAALFTDRDFNRISHERGSRSRLYARVVTPGEIEVGDQCAVNAPEN